MTRTICIYHANCADGFTAAWAVRKALGGAVEFIPAAYGDTPPDVTDANVVLVDFSYKRPVLEDMAKAAHTMLVLDHHETAEKDLEGLPVPIMSDWEAHLTEASGWVASEIAPGVPRARFSMVKSGAQLAWDFFHPLTSRPALVDYVADRDLWRFDLPHSRQIAAWLFSHRYEFGAWESCANMLADRRLFSQATYEGAAILRKHDKDVAQLIADGRREMVIGGYMVPVANLPFTMASDGAGTMAEGQPFAACYFDKPEGRVFSLRARHGGVNVAEIAATYGGGGHARAAGFQAPAGWEGDL